MSSGVSPEAESSHGRNGAYERGEKEESREQMVRLQAQLTLVKRQTTASDVKAERVQTYAVHRTHSMSMEHKYHVV